MTMFERPAPARRTHRAATGTSLLLAATLAVLALVRSLPLGAVELPSRLGDDEFWRIVTEFSEIQGSFPSNNYVSNEVAFPAAIPRLRETVGAGGVYVGVGPDQNFTYITALRPAVAFIVDIRRQNLLHHLLYKALIELSPDRETFVARLFSRPRAPGDPRFASATDILAAAAARRPDERAYGRNFLEVMRRLRQVHGFAITPDDQQVIDKVYSAFFEYGPEITYAPLPAIVVAPSNFMRSFTPFPSFTDLVTLEDGDGVNWSYLGSEDAYALLRDMQLRNLIVPVVGDFAGSKALRAIGGWVRSRQAIVTTFYTSNVEQYLFQNDVWRQYYDNVASMPTGGESTFIRAHFPTRGGIRFVSAPDGRLIPVPAPAVPHGLVPSTTLLDPVHALLAAIAAGDIASYQDLIARSR
jgi:hypothetical protein